MRIRRTAVLILTVGLFLSILAPDLQSEPRGRHLFFNLSIYYPFSINKSKSDSTNINLSLLYGHVGQVHGFDLAAVVTAVEDNVKGIQVAGLVGVCGSSLTGGQIAGLFAVAGDELSGAQVSGLFNVCGENGKGFQASSFMNVTGNSFQGIQAAGFMNVAGEESKGLQAAGFMNVTGSTYRGIQGALGMNVVGESCGGIQAAGLFNVTGERFRGLQAAGIFNVVGERFNGLQVGCMNVAATSAGVQIGLANAAGELEGVQIGLVNYSKNTIGVPVGLVNISKYDGRMRWISWASNLTGVNSGVKFSIKRIYSIVSLGSINFTNDINECLAYSGFYGVSFPLDGFSLNTDIGYMYIDNATLFRSQMGTPDQQVVMLRASLNKRLSNTLSLFAGGGLSHIMERGAPAGSSEFKPVFFAGLELF
ncbi:MAG: hypothetical protein JSV46_05480 [Candidatus Aminicenantes bacterium]|nr:MAG: hypothetical protein JSV46_05480 [Candidatus Aminicenantes bacterium]